MKKILSLLLALALVMGLFGCADIGIIGGEDGGTLIITEDGSIYLGEDDSIEEDLPGQFITEDGTIPAEKESTIDEDGWYYSAEEVALYLYTYGHLPENFITKDEARELGWEGGSVEVYAPGYAIGGDKFGNREGLLPKEKGRQYYECDIDTDGAKSRGAKRIVFSNDGLIYYTDDHYESFTLLYGEE